MIFVVWVIGAFIIVRICTDTMEKQENNSEHLDK